MNRLSMDIARFRAKMREKLVQKMDNTGTVLLEAAQRLAPVDTGRLKGSMFKLLINTPEKIAVQVHSPVHYTIFVEFGTRLWAGKPFLRPALLATSREWSKFGVATMHFAPVVPAGMHLRTDQKFKPTIIPGTMPMSQVNQKQVKIRERRNVRLAKQLSGRVKVVYHGEFRPDYTAPPIQWGDISHEHN